MLHRPIKKVSRSPKLMIVEILLNLAMAFVFWF